VKLTKLLTAGVLAALAGSASIAVTVASASAAHAYTGSQYVSSCPADDPTQPGYVPESVPTPPQFCVSPTSGPYAPVPVNANPTNPYPNLPYWRPNAGQPSWGAPGDLSPPPLNTVPGNTG
jgi:hypothetical protein